MSEAPKPAARPLPLTPRQRVDALQQNRIAVRKF